VIRFTQPTKAVGFKILLLLELQVKQGDRGRGEALRKNGANVVLSAPFDSFMNHYGLRIALLTEEKSSSVRSKR